MQSPKAVIDESSYQDPTQGFGPEHRPEVSRIVQGEPVDRQGHDYQEQAIADRIRKEPTPDKQWSYPLS